MAYRRQWSRWFNYDGAGIPKWLKPHILCDVKFVDEGSPEPVRAAVWDWTILGDNADIKQFRILKKSLPKLKPIEGWL